MRLILRPGLAMSTDEMSINKMSTGEMGAAKRIRRADI